MPLTKRYVLCIISNFYLDFLNVNIVQDKGILDGRMYSNCTVGYILSLGVCSTFRRQGVASLLLDSFLNHVTQSENQICKAIYLHVLTMNSAAIRFYEKHYFRYSLIVFIYLALIASSVYLGYTHFYHTTIQ